MNKMDEQKTTEKEKPEEPTGGSEEGNKPKASTLVDDANTAAERLEKANERKAELLRQEEELMAKKTLGGRAEAGQAPVKKEETAIEYRDRIDKEISEGKHDD